jgi:hypothetical protein
MFLLSQAVESKTRLISGVTISEAILDTAVMLRCVRPCLAAKMKDPTLYALGIAQFQLLSLELAYYGDNKQRLKEKEEALLWLNSNSVENPFDFLTLCDVFGLDPVATRQEFIKASIPPKKLPRKSASSHCSKRVKRIRASVVNLRAVKISNKRKRVARKDA